jgi:hypothetical protein
MAGPAHGPRVSITVAEAVSETFDSALDLARAFGSPVFEPAWWPADVRKISYLLDRFPGAAGAGRDSYGIGSARHDDVPICVIGQLEVPGAGRASGEWYAPRELAMACGLIGRTGVPPRLQAVVHHEELAIHLVGYETEDEIMRAATSLRRVSA